jgi:glutamate dehydrogenase/leucine dehydrogenase
MREGISAKVVVVSTIRVAICNARGFNVERLLEMRAMGTVVSK